MNNDTISYEKTLIRCKDNPCWAALRIVTLTHLLQEVNQGLDRLLGKVVEIEHFQTGPNKSPGAPQ